uniref:RBR-type E3 ubiquitin transferase n=1 Tax=Denticeps clupeoides TaxID=299321 RepID=A0AAY4A234_9TELE
MGFGTIPKPIKPIWLIYLDLQFLVNLWCQNVLFCYFSPKAMATLMAQLEEVRSRAEMSLSSSSSAQEVRTGVTAMANLALPLSSKYCHIAAENMVKENSTGNNRKERLSTALNILEKYGSNLTNSNRPKYWRTVKHNNPVFRATVDSIQGGRAVLCLYGYTNQQADGLSFPEEVQEPDVEKVASITLEVMSLRMELDMLIQVHSHPISFETKDILFFPPHRRRNQMLCLLPLPREPGRRSPNNCTICGIFPVSAQCPVCVQRLCSECDRLYHSHPARANHSRISVASTIPAKSISVYFHFSSASLSSWQCVHCTTVNRMQDVLCGTCERPRLASAAPSSATPHEEPPQSSIISEWQCKSCTVVNSASSVLCEVCERPRLATRPPTSFRKSHSAVNFVLSHHALLQWVCQFCTYVNHTPSSVCEICDLTRAEPGPPPTSLKTPSPIKEVSTPLSDKPKATHTDDLDLKRQKLMKEEGLKLIQLIREGEKNGVSPEEVYAGIHVTGNRNALPCDWLKTELPALLDEICLRAASSPHGAEAKQAWLTAGGNSEKAVIQALRDRQAKVKELSVLGFTDSARCGEALRQGGGEVRGALALLQRPLLEPFHQRMWSDQPEPPIDIHHPDKQRLCRRLLAVYDLPSWGRSELALSLLQDPTAPYTLEDVVQAVRESHDRDFIRRVLAKECPICLSVFPHSKMQSLTSCQCSVCCDCFQQHFTIAIRDKHIRDMVCPVCWEPDINDPEHLNSYFSTLDIQLRDCLEPEVYELFHKKLTEQALIKDPKFLWCSHCSYGFIYDGDQLKVTCFQCRNSFCALCKKPWESQHAGLSCEQFQLWKRENDPEYQKQGLAGYLRDNGITCPNCRFQYALARGGCMHFCCSQCRYQFCSGCNNPFHTTCSVIQCSVTGLHAHHPRDCLFYLRDWEPARLQALLQDEGTHQTDSACGAQTRPGQAGLCEKHYIEYLVSLINGHSIDPSPLFNANELVLACRRYQVEEPRSEADDDRTYYSRLLKKLMEHVPLGDKVPRKK